MVHYLLNYNIWDCHQSGCGIGRAGIFMPVLSAVIKSNSINKSGIVRCIQTYIGGDDKTVGSGCYIAKFILICVSARCRSLAACIINIAHIIR